MPVRSSTGESAWPVSWSTSDGDKSTLVKELLTDAWTRESAEEACGRARRRLTLQALGLGLTGPSAPGELTG